MGRRYFGAAGSKVIIVLVYYLITGVLRSVVFAVAIKNFDHDIEALHAYFECQKNGYNQICALDTKQNQVLIPIGYVLWYLFPVVNLVYAIRISDVKMVLKKIRTFLGLCVNNTVSSTLDTTVEGTKL